MKKLLTTTVIGVVAMLIVGCPTEGPVLEAPELAMVVMDETSVTIYWNPSIDEDSEDFAGYNVYVFTDSTLYDLAYDNDTLADYLDNSTVITDTSYSITGLDDTEMYYIQVRTVSGEDQVGDYPIWKYAKASPRPEFTVTVNMELGSGPDADCAIKFSDATIMSDENMSTDGADMWIDYWGTAPDDTVAFDSPDHHQEYGTGCKTTNLANYGQYELDDISEVTTEPTEAYVPVIVGDLVVCKTEDGNYVKVHVDNIDTVNYEVTITYAYQNISEFPHFGPQ